MLKLLTAFDFPETPSGIPLLLPGGAGRVQLLEVGGGGLLVSILELGWEKEGRPDNMLKYLPLVPDKPLEAGTSSSIPQDFRKMNLLHELRGELRRLATCVLSKLSRLGC